METHVLLLTFQECDTRYGLGRAELHQFVELGLLRPASAPETIEVEEPDELLPRLARLHHGLGLAPEAIDLVLLMRQRLLGLQVALARETARARQLEEFLRGSGPLLTD
jgi:chaperone modulatory protein CbpM